MFRPARAGSARRNLLWTAGQSVVIWMLTLAVGPALLVAAERKMAVAGFQFPGQRPLAVALFAVSSALNIGVGALLALRGGGTPLPLACPRALVITGPYRYIRNPMAVAGIGQGLAVGIWLGSWSVLLYTAAGGVLWHAAVRPAEERDLSSRFGDAYDVYRRSVPLWRFRSRAYVSPAAERCAASDEPG